MTILPLVLSALMCGEVRAAGSGSEGGDSCMARCPDVEERRWPPEGFVEDELAVRCSLWCLDMTGEAMEEVRHEVARGLHNGHTQWNNTQWTTHHNGFI